MASENFSYLHWELIEQYAWEHSESSVQRFTERAQVPGGWLVRSYEASTSVSGPVLEGVGLEYKRGHGRGVGIGLTFVPDPEHTWLLRRT